MNSACAVYQTFHFSLTVLICAKVHACSLQMAVYNKTRLKF